mmetsp:Transcript_13795/g.21801  ORF Transcript_13795/g.21801 Transcript_13795/m.21801 type:complete len:152 (-) Transcript_13795:22-477(-)
MFVKKDLRKIQEILTDDKDDREKLLLGRRAPEFGGTIHILCQKRNAPALQNLKVLSLYENNLTSVAGIGNLQHSPIVELNIGRNNLTELPDEVGRLGRTLEVLWAEDNRMERLAPGALTGCVLNISCMSWTTQLNVHDDDVCGLASPLSVR